MPVQYGSIIEEHQACRQKAALFDVSHMGRLLFTGANAAPFLDSLLTRKVLGTALGKVRYSLVCREDGGILDDILFTHLADATGNASYSLVVNASNRTKIVSWIRSRLPPDVGLIDRTLETAMLAIQGPQALALLAPHVPLNLSHLGYYEGCTTEIAGAPVMVSRTGYTGEDGCEVILPAEQAEKLWSALVTAGAKPAGLGCRDTLRLEAAMPLYGHELSETINPFQAGLDFAVNLKDREFVGRSALVRCKQDKTQTQRVGLKLAGRRVPREHYGLFAGEQAIGEVTSGTFSPTLNQPIAMAYVQPAFATPGTQLTVDIRGSREACEVVPLPFYRRK
jgi:aminomethyltransferase